MIKSNHVFPMQGFIELTAVRVDQNKGYEQLVTYVKIDELVLLQADDYPEISMMDFEDPEEYQGIRDMYRAKEGYTRIMLRNGVCVIVNDRIHIIRSMIQRMLEDNSRFTLGLN